MRASITPYRRALIKINRISCSAFATFGRHQTPKTQFALRPTTLIAALLFEAACPPASYTPVIELMLLLMDGTRLLNIARISGCYAKAGYSPAYPIQALRPR
jgi:hypothetical protein